MALYIYTFEFFKLFFQIFLFKEKLMMVPTNDYFRIFDIINF